MARNFEALSALLDQGVAEGRMPGAVALVAQGGRIVHQQASGWLDGPRSRAMPVDAHFWIASMTKPVTTAAALMLVEAGRLGLDDAVADHLPELRDLRLADGRPPARPMTVRDLMRHTSGLAYGFMGEGPVHLAYRAAGVTDPGQTNEELVRKLARLPLLHEPGTVFEYSMSTDVLGRVVEVCAGQALGDFLHARIFAPLGMARTGFEVPGAGAAAIARPFPHESFALAPPAHGARWLSGGGGLWSTAQDYVRFAQMLLDDGRWQGQQLLRPETVRAMRTDQLPAGVGYGAFTAGMGSIGPMPHNGRGFGLGLSLRLRDAPQAPPGHAGDFGWPGISGTNFWCDPAEGLVVLVLLQAPSQRLYYRDAARHAVYAGTLLAPPAALSAPPSA
ncbi:serine hydrolase [Xenophilus sp. Marseille-Q4582]|uniref:serine hydrolase domain-containing protein n=1 Tax=Xenophilus sp. Marseille-Q4582 TaxID=2866600 RepID=UPI001CE3FCBF|nr:serine hydrolase domain-containing protein [Xenophilus sp. Marseille-Q4582]